MRSDSFYVVCRVFYAVCWALTTTLSLVYMVQDAGLDPLQMLLVGTVLEASVLLFEIPTGVVADQVSRRLSVIVGLLLMGSGFLLFAAVPEFYWILAAQVVWGIGATFISGAWPAWLSGEVGVDRANRAFLTGSQLGHVGALVGIGLAIYIGYYVSAYAIATGGAGFIGLALLMCLVMREERFVPSDPGKRPSWRGMVTGARDGVVVVRSQAWLARMVWVMLIFGAFSEGWDRLFTPFLLESFALPQIGQVDGVVWWGVLAAVAHIVGLGATTLAKRYVALEDTERLSRVLSWLLLGIGVSVVVLVQLGSFFAVIAVFWLIGGLRSAYGPLLTACLNQRIPERNKATVFSLYGQADALGQVAGGPGIGAVAKSVSIGAGLMLAALLLLPGAGLLRGSAKRKVQS